MSNSTVYLHTHRSSEKCDCNPAEFAAEIVNSSAKNVKPRKKGILFSFSKKKETEQELVKPLIGGYGHGGDYHFDGVEAQLPGGKMNLADAPPGLQQIFATYIYPRDSVRLNEAKIGFRIDPQAYPEIVYQYVHVYEDASPEQVHSISTEDIILNRNVGRISGRDEILEDLLSSDTDARATFDAFVGLVGNSENNELHFAELERVLAKLPSDCEQGDDGMERAEYRSNVLHFFGTEEIPENVQRKVLSHDGLLCVKRALHSRQRLSAEIAVENARGPTSVVAVEIDWENEDQNGPAEYPGCYPGRSGVMAR